MAVVTSHLAAHVLILCGYVMACVLVPSALRALIHVRTATWVSGSGFFAFCGLTHLGLALGQQTSTWVSVTDHVQAVAILTFVPCLLLDMRAALGRFQQVLGEVPEPFIGRRIAAALQDQPGWDDPDYARRPGPRASQWSR